MATARWGEDVSEDQGGRGEGGEEELVFGCEGAEVKECCVGGLGGWEGEERRQSSGC